MNDKDKETSEEPYREYDSQELFNEIFKQATMEIKLEKQGKTRSRKDTPVLVPGRWQQQQKVKEVEKHILKPSRLVARSSEKIKGTPPVKVVRNQPAPKAAGKPDESTHLPKSMPETPQKKARRSIAPKAALPVLLLALLVGIILNYLGIVDTSLLQDYLKFGHEQVAAQSPVPGKRAAIPLEKASASQEQPQAKEHNPAEAKHEPKAPPPAPTQAFSSGGMNEDKLAELETPSTMAQTQSGTDPVEGKAPSVKVDERHEAPEIAAKQQSQTGPAQPQLSSKPVLPEPVTPQPSRPQFPYSVYLGSFKAADAVKKAISEYQKEGLSPYWAKVDLGEKGVWFRVFVEHFRTKAEAEKFIMERNIKGGTAEITRYANLIGIYASYQRVDEQRRLLVSVGFYPYVIRDAEGKSFLYSGAFDRKEYAEQEHILLASKGIHSEIVKR
jgi:SPOR domain